MNSLGLVLEHLKAGEIIAYPTEGVWGLGCDPNNAIAICLLYTSDAADE